MIVLAVLNQKGGTGKTTLATHLARGLQIDGANVALVDSDPQGSARDWSAANPQQPLLTVGLDRPSLDRDVKALRSKYDWIVIDGAARLTDMTISAVKAADVILIPVQPSPYDVWATADLVDKIKERQQLTDGSPKAAFVVSRAIQGTRIGNEVIDALNQYEFPVFENRIIQRVLFATAVDGGLTAFDAEPNSEAAKDMRGVLDELYAYVKA